jgi:hypothetical protein
MERLHLGGSTEAWRQTGEEEVAKHELGRIEASGYLPLLPLVLHAFALDNPHIESRKRVSSFNDLPVASQPTAPQLYRQSIARTQLGLALAVTTNLRIP